MGSPRAEAEHREFFKDVNCRHAFGAPVVCLKCAETVIAELHDRVRALLAERAPGWQPIESAPKDGTPIVAVGSLRHDPGRIRACVTRWHAVNEAPIYAIGWEYSAPGYGDLFDPIAWLPIPSSAGVEPKPKEGRCMKVFFGTTCGYGSLHPIHTNVNDQSYHPFQESEP